MWDLQDAVRVSHGRRLGGAGVDPGVPGFGIEDGAEGDPELEYFLPGKLFFDRSASFVAYYAKATVF
jgi:hypothetical protein